MTGWLSVIWAGLQVLLGLLRFKQSADDRRAGRDEAIVAGQKREDDALAGTQGAIDESDKKPIEYRD